ncbi:Rieske [2Fe-2S] iron-sulfur domain-containing protein [Rhexocercosporidium sp. MPI-PUGE-AT-0058]|nr:Rieske [2Fe-2S] iron-sulfur domain-containing protein [Rhexocercosporidium sp. MPI-PUGE-AT-0058]
MDKLAIALDALLYILSVSVLLIIVYALRSEKSEKLLRKLTPRCISWATSPPEKGQHGMELVEPETSVDLRQSPSWWSDDNIFELERRAIFSKTWLFVTHTSRFQKPGDYRTFEIAGFSFIIILGKDRQLRAFHNVCRHRAYAVTKKEFGSSTVLGCRYHGWSYDTKGNLVKAPEFDKVPGFDRNMNGLWEIKISSSQSMVFVNFNAASHVDTLSLGYVEIRLKRWGIAKMECFEEWKVEGTFNWKLLDSLATKWNSEDSFWGSMPDILGVGGTNQDDLEIGHTTIVRRISPSVVLILKAIPNSAKCTTVECSLYAKEPPALMQVSSLKSDIDWEIKQLAIKHKRILRNQEPIMSLAASVANQEGMNRLLGVHVDAEKKAGGEIHPAAREQSFSREGKADDDFCRELENPSSTCNANAKGLLDW